MHRSIKAFIFDLDGTLADTLSVVLEAFYATTTPRLGRRPEKEEITRYFGLSEEGILQNLFPHDWEAAFQEYLHHYEAAHQRTVDLFPGLPNLLDQLQTRRVKLGIVTGKGTPGTRISTQLLGLRRWFTHIETGAAHAPIKPQCIQRLLDTWAIPAQHAVYIGDAQYDIDAARAVSMPIVSVAWASTAQREALAAQQPDQLFDNVPAFSAWCLQHAATQQES
jgi:HAD superfamily hydrolase (TIGR01549 family)